MNRIQKHKYMDDALALKKEELDFIDYFSKWLPDELIDCHVHCNLEEHLRKVPKKTFEHMISTFTSFSLEESDLINNLMYKNKKMSSLRFPHVFNCLNQKMANEYLLKNSHANDRVALFGLPEDIPYTIKMLSHPRVSALKMYYSYVEPTATKIYDCFPKQILREAEKLKKPVIMHLPKVITESFNDLIQTVNDFPDLKIIVPHLGSTKFVIPNLKETYLKLAEKTTISLDTSLNPSAEVIFLALNAFGADRILFGSDAPLNLLRSAAYIHPTKGQRIITAYKYHWVNDKEYAEYGHLAKDAKHAHWSCLQALKAAIEKFPIESQNELKNKIFYLNAKQMFGF